MLRSLYTAATGMFGQQLNVDNIAHNMANVNTVGYKKMRVDFQDLLYQSIRKPIASEEAIEPVGLQIGLGTKPTVVQPLFSQGNLQNTQNPLDVAISGDGFFKMQVPGYEDPLYSRNGAFLVDAEGNLVNTDGYKVIGVDTIEQGAYDVKIGTDGTVLYSLPGQSTAIEAGKIEMSKFINPPGLDKLGKNLYKATENSGEAQDWDSTADSTTSLQVGYLEMSNVQVVEEMVNLITAQRAYEFNSKCITSSDDMLGIAANLKR
ncbi:MAG: flagellar basal-body rod protein FlgG [Solirubrobacterales bacterium]